ncbi:MAG TPA: VOC family protein [Actinomycetes bacterium]|nr:VOC family protein [Actinomycetes bacterium]
MTEPITAGQFHAAEGVEDWRALYTGVSAHFRTGSFSTGVALVEVIGRLADAADHHPDVDLRYGGLTVRLVTHSVQGLSDRDVALAQQISAAARELGVAADPAAVQDVEVAIDVLDLSAVRPFWLAVLGYREAAGRDYLVDPHGRWPTIWFQQMDEPRPQRNRVHVDICVPHDEAQTRIAAAVAAGGRLVSAEHAPSWWVLADPEGNEACVATWQGRD